MSTSRLRVAWLGHRSPDLGGGMATYSQETIAGLRRRGLHLTHFHHGFSGAREPQADPGASEGPAHQTVPLASVPLVKPLVLSRPRAKRELVDRLRTRDFDIVHASFWFSSLDFELPRLCHALGIPIVATFHIAFDHRLSFWGGVTSASYRLYAPALSECDRVIVFGTAQRDTLVELGVPKRVLTILPNGVDVERYCPGPSDWAQRIQAGRYFAFMGRVDSEKNVDALLRAFVGAQPPPEVKLVIVGSGTERRRLQRQFRDPRIVFTGHIADAADRIDLLRGADAFFLPSSVEGLSLSMLEAMACGVTTVATDVGTDGDALRGAGIVIDPRNLEAELSLALRQLVELPFLIVPLGRAARARALERYSLEANLDALVNLYEEVVSA